MGNGMNKILPGLYVGNFRDSKNEEQLSENGITHILAIHDNAKPLMQGKQYLCITASDNSAQDLSQFFRQCNTFIHQARMEGGAVLVHCLAGVSRSCTVTAAYIMTVTSLGWRDALNAIRGARSCANPNYGFQKQLQNYEGDMLKQERLYIRNSYPRIQYDDEEECRELLKRHLRWVHYGDSPEDNGLYPLPPRAYAERSKVTGKKEGDKEHSTASPKKTYMVTAKQEERSTSALGSMGTQSSGRDQTFGIDGTKTKVGDESEAKKAGKTGVKFLEMVLKDTELDDDDDDNGRFKHEKTNTLVPVALKQSQSKSDGKAINENEKAQSSGQKQFASPNMQLKSGSRSNKKLYGTSARSFLDHRVSTDKENASTTNQNKVQFNLKQDADKPEIIVDGKTVPPSQRSNFEARCSDVTTESQYIPFVDEDIENHNESRFRSATHRNYCDRNVASQCNTDISPRQQQVNKFFEINSRPPKTVQKISDKKESDTNQTNVSFENESTLESGVRRAEGKRKNAEEKRRGVSEFNLDDFFD